MYLSVQLQIDDNSCTKFIVKQTERVTLFQHTDYTFCPARGCSCASHMTTKDIWIIHKSMTKQWIMPPTPPVGQWKLFNTKEYNNCSKVQHTFISLTHVLMLSWARRNAWCLGLWFSYCDDSAKSFAPCGLKNVSDWGASSLMGEGELMFSAVPNSKG